MLKQYLRECGKSIYSLSGQSNVPYSTLNDLVNGKVAIEQCNAGIVFRIAEALGISMDELYEMCSTERMCVSTSYGVEAEVFVKSKAYYIEFEYEDLPVEIRLCRINEDTQNYVAEIARWRAEEYIRNMRLAAFGVE